MSLSDRAKQRARTRHLLDQGYAALREARETLWALVAAGCCPRTPAERDAVEVAVRIVLLELLDQDLAAGGDVARGDGDGCCGK